MSVKLHLCISLAERIDLGDHISEDSVRLIALHSSPSLDGGVYQLILNGISFMHIMAVWHMLCNKLQDLAQYVMDYMYALQVGNKLHF